MNMAVKVVGLLVFLIGLVALLGSCVLGVHVGFFGPLAAVGLMIVGLVVRLIAGMEQGRVRPPTDQWQPSSGPGVPFGFVNFEKWGGRILIAVLALSIGSCVFLR